jgi:hypothetical protein
MMTMTATPWVRQGTQGALSWAFHARSFALKHRHPATKDAGAHAWHVGNTLLPKKEKKPSHKHQSSRCQEERESSLTPAPICATCQAPPS